MRSLRLTRSVTLLIVLLSSALPWAGAEAQELIERLENPTEIVGENLLGQKTLKVDVALEDLVIEKLKGAGLGGILVTEEKGEVDLGEGDLTFVLDPLGGSSNFVRKVPNYGLVICVAEGEYYDDVTHSYIRHFVSGQEYWSIKGEGAFMDGEPIKCQDPQ